ncbi:hypothetical protein K320107C7_26410 [Alistipes shahii]|jgi:hypothetical protein|uniref:Uncharacterized protein n=1 Tax=Alistipes shahii WAL 8301 TaxID=717959 RepID=D4IMQ1_9BACT|nr:hypothetical protein AL1_18460 [Alistipes shahii WAL 8301]
MIDLWVWSNTNAIQEKTTDPPSHQPIVFQIRASAPKRMLATNSEMIEAPTETNRSNARINRELI